MAEDTRPDPESFLDLEKTLRKGHLKVFIGGAAGVGKTWRMLDEAHQLRRQGIDVVIGVIETHGRADTAAKVGDLEIIPQREVSYRGVMVHEMDLDAILTRAPDTVLVDELAHTNVPGSRHDKRYQDVEELLAAGINVITALNIQHVESLVPLVRRLVGIEVREIVPDAFLARADQLINVDLPVDALRERLREGKIYPSERIEQALKNFFKPANLASLRELALREVARGLSRQRADQEVLRREGGRRPTVSDRLMVCLSANPASARALLFKASRTAGQLGVGWYAVHVETAFEAKGKVSTADFRALLDNVNLASDLGAEVIWLKETDVAQALVNFARDKAISKIIVGRSRAPWWRRLTSRSLVERVLGLGQELDVEVVGTLEEGK